MLGKVSRSRFFGLIGVASLVVISDQGSKAIARWWGLAHRNQGGVLGLLPGEWWWLLSCLLLVLIIAYLVRGRLSNCLEWGWLVILGAGISNLLDRFIWGGVWDWINYPVINVVGNLADVWLGIGVCWLLWIDVRS